MVIISSINVFNISTDSGVDMMKPTRPSSWLASKHFGFYKQGRDVKRKLFFNLSWYFKWIGELNPLCHPRMIIKKTFYREDHTLEIFSIFPVILSIFFIVASPSGAKSWYLHVHQVFSILLLPDHWWFSRLINEYIQYFI